MKQLPIKSSVESALTTGEIPERIIEKIYKESVWIDDPEQKKEMRKSSNDIIIERRNATKIAGYKKGTITWKKVYCIEAPRSSDASIRLLSSSSYRPLMIGIANPSPSSVCPAIKVVNPKGTKRHEKRESIPTASTISGIKALA